MFVKGQSGNPGGRAKGSKNKAYLSLRYWFEMIADNSAKLAPKEKIEIAFRAVNVLAPKIPVLPTEPGDSVDNALRAQSLLQAIEVQAEAAEETLAQGNNGNHPNP